MDTINIELDVARTAGQSDLEFSIRLDGKVIYKLDADADHVKFEIDDDQGDHELVFELAGKQPTHTKIDDQGRIIEDAVITVNNIIIDDLDVNSIFSEQSKYQHNFNGTGDQVTERFYDTMGCNGTVTLKFSTPIYLWLLENM